MKDSDKFVRFGMVAVVIAAVMLVLFPLALMAQDSTLSIRTPIVENDILPSEFPASALPADPVSNDTLATVEHALSVAPTLAIATSTHDHGKEHAEPLNPVRRAVVTARRAGAAISTVRPFRRLRGGGRVFCGPGGCS